MNSVPDAHFFLENTILSCPETQISVKDSINVIPGYDFLSMGYISVKKFPWDNNLSYLFLYK